MRQWTPVQDLLPVRPKTVKQYKKALFTDRNEVTKQLKKPIVFTERGNRFSQKSTFVHAADLQGSPQCRQEPDACKSERMVFRKMK